MKYSKIISVGEQFKNSVNIEYDLLTYEKLSAYIPTEDVCEVLKYYLDSVEDSDNIRSTILEGPYGKGKSYLVLTLLQLLQLDVKDKNVKAFLKKLKVINNELHDQYLRIKNNGVKLLPVIINSNYAHLPQALNMALKDALDRIGLSELFPNTAFEVSLSVIEQWKNDSEIDSKVINKCLEQTGVTLETLERGLKEYSIDSFNKFVNLYNCVVKGLNFNPFASNDVVKNYSDIAYKLSEYGYFGIFVVFDEFSKFIEADNRGLSADLKVLQDLAEMVNRSGKQGQMHLCCITHKSLSSYYKNKKDTTINAFRTVEGRFKEIRFNRSLNQNYQIISLTLNKTKDFKDFFKGFYKNNEEFYKTACGYEIFKDIDNNLITEGCFPLNPLTTYAVVNVSELIAQNERTLFTFISDNDTNSLSTFIKNCEEGLFNVDKIYDYFSNLLEKSEEDDIRKLYYKAQICLSKVGDILAKRVVKALTIIKIMNDDNFVPTLGMISSCLDVEESKVVIVLNELTDSKLLKKSFATEYYDFALASSKVIDTKVDSFLSSKAKIENLSSVLNNLFDSEFVLPRKYNAKHKMTRFYKQKYISDFELMNLNSFAMFFKKEFSDGFILNVINTGLVQTEIKQHFFEIDDNSRVILRLTNKEFDKQITNEAFRINALQTVLADKNLDEIVKEETRLIIADEINELEHVLSEIYSKKNLEIVSKYSALNYVELLSEVMENVYCCTPVINNEMMNKEQGVSSQYVKPRNTIVNLYLNKKIEKNQKSLEGYSSTSPESTVFNSVKETDSLEKRKVLDEIKCFLNSSEGRKECVVSIVEKLRNAPYGLRSGVLPIVISMAISELDDNLLLYFENKEIDLTADSINKMVVNPEKYYFSLEKGSNEKTSYLNEMLESFGLHTTNSYRDDIKLVVSYIQKWVMSQPRIVRSQNKVNNYIGVDDTFIEVKSIFTAFNINEHESLFEKLPAVFENDYKQVVKAINNYKSSLEDVVRIFTKDLAKRVKDIIGADSKSSLTSAFEDWIKDTNANKRILDDKKKSFITLFDDKDYDDVSVMNSISKNLVRTKIADWEKDNSTEIIEFIMSFVNSIYDNKLATEVIEESQRFIAQEDDEEISVMGNLLKNNIEEAFEEFADSVSNEEKIKILSKLIKEMM